MIALLLLLTVGTAVWAQSSANFDLSWNVIGSGGAVSNSASYALQGTIGQSVASQPSAGSASFGLNSGYWPLGQGTTVYLPTILNQ